MTAEPETLVGVPLFPEVDDLVRRLGSGLFETAVLRVLAPFVPAVTTGWAVATLFDEYSGTSPAVTFLLAAAAAAFALILYLLMPDDLGPVVAALVAIGGSSAIQSGLLAPVIIPGGVAIVVGATTPPTGFLRRRVVGDRCVLVIPACATAVIANVAGRIDGWTPHRAVAAAVTSLLAIAVAYFGRRISQVGLLPVPLGVFALTVTMIGLGWSWTRIAILASFTATTSCVVFVMIYEYLTHSVVERVVTRELMYATRSSSRKVYDDLHEIIIARLASAAKVAARSDAPEVTAELLDTELIVRSFRATSAAEPSRRVSETLDAVSRRYQTVMHMTRPSRPSDTAIHLSYAEARVFQRIANELLGNAARHGLGDDGRVAVTVTATNTNGRFVMELADDGPGLAAVGPNGVLHELIRSVSARPGWSLEHVRNDGGAKFRLAILHERTSR